jgi:tetratricopeptide (TPR) repeat protein
MPSSSGTDGQPGLGEPNELLRRQAAALERLAEVSDPEYKPRQKVVQKLIAAAIAGSGVVLGTYEFAQFVIESHERRAMVANWVEAARELYEVEGSADEAGELLKRAEEVAQQDVDVVKLGAYIDGMRTVERLVNLDRPFDKSDMEAYGRAMGQAVMLERVDPGSPEWAILRGQLALAAREPDRARAFLDRALAIDPRSAFATLRLALVHLDLAKRAASAGDRDRELAEARRLVDRSIELAPRFKWGHLWKGVVALEVDKDADAAIASFRKAVEIDPRFANGWYSIGAATETKEDWAATEQAYVRSLEIRPDLDAALSGLAFVYGSQDKYEIGLRYARRATDANPGSLKAWNMRGRLARELALVTEARDAEAAGELWKEAIDAYSKALDLDPRMADAYIERSDLNLRTKRLAEAGEDARNATMFAPQDPYAWNALGRYQLQAGFPDKAVETFAKVLALDAAFDTALLDRARALDALGQRDAAVAELDRALEKATEDFRTDILLERGRIREAARKLDAALGDFVAARTAKADLFEAWMSEARVLKALGRTDEARAAAREALQLRPDDEGAKAMVGG